MHGIHSPFVFQLEKKCLKDRKIYDRYKDFKNYKKALQKDKSEIIVKDFGDGSRVFKSNSRKVARIGQVAGATQKRMQLLYRLSSYFKTATVLELGTSLGTATFAFNPEYVKELNTVEGCPETAKKAQAFFNQFHYKLPQISMGIFTEELTKLSINKFDLIYFDGNHNKEATLSYVNRLLSTAHNESIWIFDDIHWSAAMTQAWQEICKLPQITVSIDCFWFGLVFFRKEQMKQDFFIRI